MNNITSPPQVNAAFLTALNASLDRLEIGHSGSAYPNAAMAAILDGCGFGSIEVIRHDNREAKCGAIASIHRRHDAHVATVKSVAGIADRKTSHAAKMADRKTRRANPALQAAHLKHMNATPTANWQRDRAGWIAKEQIKAISTGTDEADLFVFWRTAESDARAAVVVARSDAADARVAQRREARRLNMFAKTYSSNGKREIARRLREIAAGALA